MSIVTILYPHRTGARFDAAYYADTHAKLVDDVWHPQSTTLVAGTGSPTGGPAAFVMIAHFHFASAGAMAAALASPRTAECIADVHNFTDIEPIMMLGEAAL